MQASPTTYFVSPSVIAPVGQVPAQAPHFTHSSETTCMIFTSVIVFTRRAWRPFVDIIITRRRLFVNHCRAVINSIVIPFIYDNLYQKSFKETDKKYKLILCSCNASCLCPDSVNPLAWILSIYCILSSNARTTVLIIKSDTLLFLTVVCVFFIKNLLLFVLVIFNNKRMICRCETLYFTYAAGDIRTVP